MSLKNLAEGKEIEAECVVSSQRRNRGGFNYRVTDGKGDIEFFSKEEFRPGEGLFIVGTVVSEYGILRLKPKLVQRRDRVFEKVLQKAEENVQVEIKKPLADGLMEKLLPRIEKAARRLLAAKKTGRLCLLRFHNDADGIVGALAINSILNVKSFQQNSAIYRIKDAMMDLNLLRHESSPLAIFVDTGSGEESMEGLRLLKAGGAEILIIDHHPPSEEAEELCSVFLSPWAVSEKETASSYPAGYLAIEVARACGNEKPAELAGVACAGDKSKILETGEKEREKALVLDFMATYAEFRNKLEFYGEVFEKRELYSSILSQAREKLERVGEELKKRMKKKLDGPVIVYTVNLEDVSAREFPGKGKLTSQAFENVLPEGAVVVIGVWEGGASLRISGEAVKRGANANEIISSLKGTMGDFIISGGGHGRAASLRIKTGFTKEVVGEIIRIISQLQASQPQE